MKSIKLILVAVFGLANGLGLVSAYGSDLGRAYDRYDCFGYTFFSSPGQIAFYRGDSLIYNAVPQDDFRVFRYRYLNRYYDHCFGWGGFAPHSHYRAKATFRHNPYRYQHQMGSSGYYKRLQRVLRAKPYQQHYPVKALAPASSIRSSRTHRFSHGFNRSFRAGPRW
jgi:hypothetical protein